MTSSRRPGSSHSEATFFEPEIVQEKTTLSAVSQCVAAAATVGCAKRPAMSQSVFMMANDQRLSAALTNPAEVKASNAADKPRWTEPLLVKELTLAVQGVESLAWAGMRKLWL